MESVSDDSIFEFVVPTSVPISEEESHDDDIQNLTSNNNLDNNLITASISKGAGNAVIFSKGAGNILSTQILILTVI